jgi:hypothetical protein
MQLASSRSIAGGRTSPAGANEHVWPATIALEGGGRTNTLPRHEHPYFCEAVRLEAEDAEQWGWTERTILR